jgi:hypothetical protein
MAISQMSGVVEDLAAAWTAHDIDKVLSLCTDDCVYEDVREDQAQLGLLGYGDVPKTDRSDGLRPPMWPNLRRCH